MICARGCATTHHLPGCPGEDCKGCVPRSAAVGSWCAGCVSRVRGWLADLPYLAADVARLPEGKLNMAPGPVTDAPRAPSPEPQSVSPAFDTADEVRRWLLSWTDMICDSLALNGPARYNVAGLPVSDASVACSRFLREWVTWPAEHEPIQFYAELAQLSGLLERALGADVVVERIQRSCPRCDLRMLTREDGQDSVVCGNVDCLAVWRSEEWAALVGASA